ncbi:unnamed protein product [Mytilus edulis]|uniref:Uncharacterized protein n=1 Tax=Mytilus edulis TaxID=6550 RepID=A0A8S3S9W0_MYTED|nr:unnamed protein product [Mytilus edulis]
MVSTISEPTLRSFHTVPTIKTLDEFILSVRVAEGSQLPYLGYVEVNIKAPFHTEPMMVPLLVVPETDYNRSVPIIIGTNVLRPMKSTLTSDSEVNIPHEWDTAFSAMDSSIVSLVKSTNKRPIKVSPMSSMTVTGLCKAKSSIQTAVTECVDDNQSSLGVCPRVVNLKSTGTNRIPVRIFNMSTKVIYVKPKSVLCGLNEVKIVRHAALDSSVEETGEKASDECDKGKILKNIGVELTEVTPETKTVCTSSIVSPGPFIETVLLTESVATEDLHEVSISKIDWHEEQNADPSIRRIIALVQGKHKPTKRKISLETEEVRRYLRDWDKFTLKDGILYRNSSLYNEKVTQLVLPSVLRDIVLQGLHDDVGHQDEIVRQQIPSSCKKGKTFTRPQNLQKDDTVDSDKNELMLTEVRSNSSDEDDDDICIVATRSPRVIDPDRSSQLVLNPQAPEFLPSSSSSSLPVSDLSSSRPDFSGDLLSDTSGQSSVHSGVNDSSTLSGMSASGHTENNSVAFEATDTQPVLRRTTRQCRAPQRYQDFILYR